MPANIPATLRDVHGPNDTLAAQIADAIRSLTGRMLEDASASKQARRVSAPQLMKQVMTSIVQSLLLDDVVAQRQRTVLAQLLLTANLRKTGVPAALQSSPLDDEADDPLLSSEEAAKLLHVSRTHINMLIDSGKLGEITRTVGGHRRIAKTAVLKYKAESKQRRARGVDVMVESSERLGLYDTEDASLTYDMNEMAKKKAAARVRAGKKGSRSLTR
jgi:excisionase family DNA binding protein